MADAFESAESPQLDEVEPEEATESKPEGSDDELGKLLAEYNIQSPDDFASLVQREEKYRRGYGESRNEVGELRRELQAMREQMSKPKQEYDPEYGQPVDIERLVAEATEKSVRRVVEDMTRQQREAQQAYYRERRKVETKPNWKHVQPYFDKAIQSPEIQAAMQSGEMTMTELYHDLNERLLMSRVKSVYEKIPKDGFNAPDSPETGDRVAQPLPKDVERKERIKKAVAKFEPEAVLNELIPDGDPILRL